jgi:hypothetical protein
VATTTKTDTYFHSKSSTLSSTFFMTRSISAVQRNKTRVLDKRIQGELANETLSIRNQTDASNKDVVQIKDTTLLGAKTFLLERNEIFHQQSAISKEHTSHNQRN